MNPTYIITSYLKKMPFENKQNRNEDINSEKFILEVKKRECIWNVNSKSYSLKCHRNRATKRQAWHEIGKIFHANWDNLAPDEKQKKVVSMSRKWANIRKYYTDELRRPSDSPAKKRQRRKYHHILSFLDNIAYKKHASKTDDFKNVSRENYTNDSSSDSESNALYIVEDSNELAKLSEKYENTHLPDLNDNTTPNPKISEKQDFFPKLFETESTLSNNYDKTPYLLEKERESISPKFYERQEDVPIIFVRQGPIPRTYEKHGIAPKTYEKQYHIPKNQVKLDMVPKAETQITFSNVINDVPKTFENQINVPKTFIRRPTISIPIKKPLTNPEIKPDIEISLKYNAPIDVVIPNAEKSDKNSLTAARNPEIMKLLTEEPRAPTRPLTDSPILNSLLVSPATNNPMFFNKQSTFDINADACKKFLFSLLPELMSLNVRQIMQFRVEILNLLRDIKFK